MTERKTKICLISPTENLAKRARALITRQGMNIRVEVADLESAVSLAKRLSEKDDYLFISRRGTRDLLCKSLNIHVVNIPSEASDYIPAIQQLRNEQGLIAFFSFEEISNELRTICYLLNLRMRHYCFSDSLSCQSAVRRAIADGAVWGLGGVVSERFAKMYGFIARSMMEAGGKRGERAVREAVIRYGRDLGEGIRKAYLELGKKTNLHTLFQMEPCCGTDPRFKRNIIKDTEEVQLQEVYHCPLAEVWKREDCTEAGRCYCEELAHSLLDAYTDGRGQANVSNSMTCDRDFFCRFAFYLRPANMDEDQKEQCFGNRGEESGRSGQYPVEDRFLLLYGHLAAAAEEFLGQDGLAALADGLDQFLEDAVKTLKKEAEHTGSALDDSFVSLYFPVEIPGQTQECREESSGAAAFRLLESRLVSRLRKKLCL